MTSSRKDSTAKNISPGQAPSLWRIFASCLRLGLTAFGGPAMVAYIREMSVVRRRWLDEDTFEDGVALVQAVPGATAMQARLRGTESKGRQRRAAKLVVAIVANATFTFGKEILTGWRITSCQ